MDKGPRTPPPQILLPLEERVTHFRDMLLERGVRTLNNPEGIVGSREPSGDPWEGLVFLIALCLGWQVFRSARI